VNTDPKSWFLWNSGPGAADDNMAIDESLLEFASQLGRPILRFYGWRERAASFGYSQKYAEVARMTLLRPLVRRPTGGGLVPHDADWTYSLVFPPGDWWYRLRARESYRTVHEWIRDAFAWLKVETDLSPCRIEAPPGQCFVGAEQFDLLWHGRKVAGAAQRRSRQGLLIQGSVQPPPIGLAKADWQKAMCDVPLKKWKVNWAPFEPTTSMNRRAQELVEEKYALEEYRQRR
jgi:lipoyl(octanoyl) transferase